MRRFSWIHLLWAAMFTALLSACAGVPERRFAPVTPAHDKGRRGAVVRHALAEVGTPYDYGGETPGDGFDCSGLIYYSFLQAGLHVPRTAIAQWSTGFRVALKRARAGDLVFYHFGSKPGGLHVGLYLGHERMVHASTGHGRVVVVNIDEPWWWAHYLGVRRMPALALSK